MPENMSERVLACAACHGKAGEGDAAYFPRLAGQPSDYLYQQLLAFRAGQRKYPAMNYLTTYLSDDYLLKMALYFSAMPTTLPAAPLPVTPVSTETLAKGKAIATLGDPGRAIPACVSCHGARLTGNEPSIPGLVGLSQHYLSAQLGAYRTGVRHGTSPDCMREVAWQMNDADIHAVSAWISVMPLPEDMTPAAAGTLALPLRCGSASGRH